MNRRKTGTAYETLAAAYLTEQGYQIVTKNYRCRFGEIDLIARDGKYLVFIEVKYRFNSRLGTALQAVNVQKQKTIRNVARYYLMVCHQSEETPCRFDVVGITGTELLLVKDAF